MKEKYEDLFAEEASLCLPIEYKHLQKLFEYLDNNLNFVKSRKIVPTFSLMKEAIEKSLGKQFTLDHIKQIMHVAPTFYNVKWELKENVSELVIEVPQNIK
jgi:hypothetical protein